MDVSTLVRIMLRTAPDCDPAGTPAKVLVIEDDDAIRAVVSAALEDEGYQVVNARDGAEGLQVARTEQPRIILLDMRMPVIDGWEFTRRYRAEHASPHDCGL
jgi:CheY-like chemotaxis protein